MDQFLLDKKNELLCDVHDHRIEWSFCNQTQEMKDQNVSLCYRVMQDSSIYKYKSFTDLDTTLEPNYVVDLAIAMSKDKELNKAFDNNLSNVEYSQVGNNNTDIIKVKLKKRHFNK